MIWLHSEVCYDIFSCFITTTYEKLEAKWEVTIRYFYKHINLCLALYCNAWYIVGLCSARIYSISNGRIVGSNVLRHVGGQFKIRHHRFLTRPDLLRLSTRLNCAWKLISQKSENFNNIPIYLECNLML